MGKTKSFMAGLLIGITSMYVLNHGPDKAENGYRPTAIFDGAKVELTDLLPLNDTTWVREPSGMNYAVDISSNGKQNLVGLGRNNLFYYDGAEFKQTDQGYEQSIAKIKNMGINGWLAVLSNDTLYQITPGTVYTAFDGIGGYEKLNK